MKIAIVHSFYSSLIPSGENNVVLAQVDALRKIGHDVRLIAEYTDQLSESPFYKLRTALNIVAQRGSSPLEQLRAFQPDIVHVHNLFPNYSRAWVHSWDGPLVVTLHNFRPVCAAGTLFRDGSPCSECVDFGSHRSVVNRCYRGSALAIIPLAVQTRGGIDGDPLLRRADRIILLAQRAYETYRSLGLEEQKMDLLPNFVDQTGFRPNEGPGSHWTYIGRLAAEKGIMNLVRSWPQGHLLRIIGYCP
jgi:glycosyltransferase involved in cell wall biosynthesis